MKKLAITLSLAVIGTMSAFSQGTIDFIGGSAYPITIATSTSGTATKIGAANATSVALGAGGGQVTVEIFVGTSTGNFLLAGITTNFSATLGLDQGAFSGNTQYTLGSNPGTSTNTFAAYTQGTTVDFYYYAYTANGLYTGESPTETGYSLGGGVTSPSATFGTSAGEVDGFEMLPTPEPSTIALGGLGAAALLLFRRRK